FRARIMSCSPSVLPIMFANTEPAWRQGAAAALDIGFQTACGFFVAEYVLRLLAAAGAPAAEDSGTWRTRLSWAPSSGGICGLVGTWAAVLTIIFGARNASLAGFVWAFKLVRYAPALASLQQVISDSRHALLSVLLGFGIVMLVAASLAYLLERGTQPRVFGSIPAALWWAIVTLTTTGYGDVLPLPAPAR